MSLSLILVSVVCCLIALMAVRRSVLELREELEELGRQVGALEAMARAEELHGYEPNRGRVHVQRGRIERSGGQS